MDIIQATPSEKLTDLNVVPEMLIGEPAFRERFVPEGPSLNPATANIRWNMEKSSTYEQAQNQIIEECGERPKALIVDEAHEMSKDIAHTLCNLATRIAGEAKFLLVLGGPRTCRPADKPANLMTEKP